MASLAMVVLAPWWIWCGLHLGSVIPEGGAAVHQQVALHQALLISRP